MTKKAPESENQVPGLMLYYGEFAYQICKSESGKSLNLPSRAPCLNVLYILLSNVVFESCISDFHSFWPMWPYCRCQISTRFGQYGYTTDVRLLLVLAKEHYSLLLVFAKFGFGSHRNGCHTFTRFGRVCECAGTRTIFKDGFQRIFRVIEFTYPNGRFCHVESTKFHIMRLVKILKKYGMRDMILADVLHISHGMGGKSVSYTYSNDRTLKTFVSRYLYKGQIVEITGEGPSDEDNPILFVDNCERIPSEFHDAVVVKVANSTANDYALRLECVFSGNPKNYCE